MAPVKLKELKTQLDELQEKGYISTQHITMGSPDIFCEEEGQNP